MRALLAEARLAATGEQPVLIQGETGTGKELLARFVHDQSSRSKKPFVAVNCAAIPETLFEREFFGNARGAYTGADRDGPGLVDEADGGTLFLDEVGEMPISVQPILLRLLQDGSYRRVGETRNRKADLRIVAASNRPLSEAVEDRAFRSDLFYRLCGFELVLPPLRERGDDLVPLILTFLRRQPGAEEALIQPAALVALRSYHWPGNIRELESTVGSAWVRARSGGVVRESHLPPVVRSAARRIFASRLDLGDAIRRTEREMILEALEQSEYRRTEAAELLGIGRNTLYEKMKRLGISPEQGARATG